MVTPHIINWINGQKELKTTDISKKFGVSRQYANRLLNLLVSNGRLIKIGSTRTTRYLSSEYAAAHPEVFPVEVTKTYRNHKLEEHKVLDEIERRLPTIGKLRENIKSVFTYAFSEMLNNAIEHSKSKNIVVEVAVSDGSLSFTVTDSGIGVFRNIMEKRKLKSELEAIQDLLKGKTTTMPKSHSGEGIFFTSKAGDLFMLNSFGQELIVNNKVDDLFVKRTRKIKRGTRVNFKIATNSNIHLQDIFKKYTNIDDQSDYGFDRTEIKIKLYIIGGVHVSRSQARRVLAGLEKFKSIIFDFDQVPMIGQAFADEIFRVFQNKHPEIKIEAENMNDGVKFMVNRVEDRRSKTAKLFKSE